MSLDESSQSRVDELRGKFIRQAALLEEYVLGALWEFLGIEPLLYVDESPEGDILGPVNLYANMSAELGAASKVNLLRRCLQLATLEHEFPELVRSLNQVYEIRNTLAHAYGQVFRQEGLEGEWLDPTEGEVAFLKSGRGSPQQHWRQVDFTKELENLSFCMAELHRATLLFDDFRRSYIALSAARSEGLGLKVQGNDIRCYCQNCQCNLGAFSSEHAVLEAWRTHECEGFCT